MRVGWLRDWWMTIALMVVLVGAQLALYAWYLVGES